MGSFTDSLKEDMSSEREYSEWCFKMACSDLKSARDQKGDLDVSDYVENIRCWMENEGFTLTEIGTTEEELEQLVQTGYESEARTCLELSRHMYGHSRLYLYARAVRNIGRRFFKEPRFRWFRLLLATLFCLRPRYTRQHYIALTREYLAKANFSLSDIGTDETELVRLGS